MGGAEYQTHLLAEELARRPNVQVCYLARRVPEAAAAADLSYSVRGIGNATGIRRRAVFFDADGLSRALAEIRPDVIYQQMKQSYSAVCAAYARRAGIPFFLHIASEWDLDPSWMPLRLSLNTPFDVVEAITGNWGLRRATHIVVQTESQGQKLRDRFKKEAALLVRTFQPLPSELIDKPPGKRHVVWVGNLKEVKRRELFLDLAESLVDRGDFRFHMVGRPWMHRRAAPLMERIAGLKNLDYHGELPQARVNSLISSSSFFVNTSAHEGFPNTFIQAWANGAVLLSLVVDPYDGMEGLGIGFLTGTLERMKDRLLELANQPARRDAVAARAFEFVHGNHSPAEGERLADAIIASTRAGVFARSG